MSKICPNCGNVVSDQASFCNQCGCKIAVEHYSGDGDIQIIHRKKKNGAIVGILVGIAICVIIVVMYNFSDDNIVDRIQASYITRISENVTVGEAFQNHFEDENWMEYKDGKYTYVRFTGLDKMNLLEWEVVFKYRNEKFLVDTVTIDGSQYNSQEDIDMWLDFIWYEDDSYIMQMYG